MSFVSFVSACVSCSVLRYSPMAVAVWDFFSARYAELLDVLDVGRPFGGLERLLGIEERQLR